MGVGLVLTLVWLIVWLQGCYCAVVVQFGIARWARIDFKTLLRIWPLALTTSEQLLFSYINLSYIYMFNIICELFLCVHTP